MATDKAIIEDAVSFITANGNNSAEEASEYWARGAEENAQEARENDWTRAGDWAPHWTEIGEAVAAYYAE